MIALDGARLDASLDGLVPADAPANVNVATTTVTPYAGDPTAFTSQDINGLLIGSAWTGGNVTFSFPTLSSQYGTYAGYYGALIDNYGDTTDEELHGFQAFSAAQQSVARYALGLIASYANLTFTEVTESSSVHATIRFADSSVPPTSWAYYPGTGYDEAGDVWLGNVANATPTKGSYAFGTILHELGHAVGLKHGQVTSAPYGALPANHNSTEWSIMTYMSYLGSPGTAYTNADGSGNQTYMADDIAALQYLYGANFNTNSGNTTYSWSLSTGEMSINGVGQGAATLSGGGNANKVYEAIWDGGGTDTYDLSNYTTNLNVDLRPGEWSTFAVTQLADLGSGHQAHGNIDNANLYHGDSRSLIENAYGGTGADIIRGNDAANVLRGNAGNDILEGGAGADYLDGGSGVDIATYIHSATAITIDLAHGTASGDAAGDVYNGIELIQMTPFADVFYASGAAAWVQGNDGGDTLYGGAGADYLDGGNGDDRLEDGVGAADTLAGGPGNDLYHVDSAGTTVLENAGDGFDMLTTSLASYTLPLNVEIFEQAATVQTMNGNAQDNIFRVTDHSQATIDGGSGIDTLSFLELQHGVSINLASGGGDASGIVLTSIEHYQLTMLNDVFVAAPGGSWVDESVGDDYFYGGSGADTAYGGANVDVLVMGAGDDIADGGDGQDYLFGGDGNDTLYGGTSGVDVLNGDAGNNIYYTSIQGGYVYDGAGAGLAYGGAGNDIFVMDAGNDVAYGGAGQDYFYMSSGDDQMYGGAGVDVMVGQGGNDTFEGGADVDYFFLNAGFRDTVIVNAVNDGVAVVNSFDPAQDLIRLQSTGWSSLADVQAHTYDFTAAGGFMIISVDADTAIWLIGVQPGQLSAANFQFL